jgi:hypothetical protein
MDCPTCGKSLSSERGMRQHHTKVHGDPLPNRTCADCGIRFYDPKAQRKYCDGCDSQAGEKNGNYSDAKESTSCNRCGASFEYYPSNKDGLYCPGCVTQASGVLPAGATPSTSKVSVDCEQCSETLLRYPSEITSTGYGSFCDLDCYGSWLSEHVVGDDHHQWEGGVIPYGSEWWSVRKAALERDGYRCRVCGKSAEDLGRNPDVHHLTRVRAFDEPAEAHFVENVVCLCRSCHRLVETGAREAPQPNS